MFTLPTLVRRPLCTLLGGLAAASVIAMAPGTAGVAHAAGSSRIANGAPVAPGGVALTWSPAYMTDSHAFTAADATAMAQKFDMVASMPAAFGKYSASMRQTNPDITLLAYSNATLANASAYNGLPESPSPTTSPATACCRATGAST